MTDHDPSLDNWLEGIDLSENAPDEASVLTDGEVDLKALLLRRFAWDTMACSRVEALLPKLGLTLSTPEGTEKEHLESHHRMASVLPFEHLIRDYSVLLGTVLTTAITEAAGIADQMSPEDQLGYVQQNVELILAGGRAMMAQLFFMGLIDYGPIVEIHTAHVDEHGEIVLDEPAADDGQLPGQLSFDDAESGSE